MADIQRHLSQARDAVRPMFHLWPSSDAIVIAIPAGQELTQHSHYIPPKPHAGLPGVFHVNLAHVRSSPRPEAAVVSFHEVWPGHHVQLSIAQEANLCAFRRAVLFAAYLEGWAKYAESLPQAVGLGCDRPTRIACLRTELYSTATLVMDTGIHLYGWTADRAKRFFVEATGAPISVANMVVMRSAAQPGQLCAYKIGLLKFRELRDKFSTARGKNFRIQDFHDAILCNGALPLGILEDIIGQSLERLSTVRQ